MGKKKLIVEEPQSEVTSTEVSLIVPQFTQLEEFKLPTVDESLAIIAKKRTDNAGLVIAGVDDKLGYEAVKAAMGQMKNDRIAFVNAATENIIDPANKYLKQFKADLEKIADEFKAGEKDLRDKKDAIDTEKERIKKEAELEKIRIMQTRMNEVTALGAEFDGMVYTFPYSQSLLITAEDLKEYTAEEFEAFVHPIKTSYQAEQDRLAEVDRLKEEQETENRLRLEQEENDRLEREAELKRQGDELTEKRTKLRLKEFKLLGAALNTPELFSFPTIGYEGTVSLDFVKIAEDVEWEELIFDLENFTPAEEPLVKEGTNAGFNIGVQNADKDIVNVQGDFAESSQAATYNPNSHLNTRVDPSTIAYDFEDEVTKVDFVTELTLSFDDEKPFEEVEISAKYVLRLFPDEYADEAVNGRKVANEGKVQGLNFAIVLKA